MLKLLRDVLTGGQVRPIPAGSTGARTELVSAQAHVSQTAATFGRCR
ncbi:hypothetical protein KSP35_17945 [Aquihabitans sp. G128]|nr:hypothetical protein [Aquihabitans sp. G128]QXC60211.1 hypothetical protein KSP35_17945 [Aquihabitans sp. G128]